MALVLENIPWVSRMMKGVFKLRPSLPKYTVTYDVTILLNYMTECLLIGKIPWSYILIKWLR